MRSIYLLLFTGAFAPAAAVAQVKPLKPPVNSEYAEWLGFAGRKPFEARE